MIISMLEMRGMVVIQSKTVCRIQERSDVQHRSRTCDEECGIVYSMYAGEKGFIAFNLFLADFINRDKAEVKPYADLRKVA